MIPILFLTILLPSKSDLTPIGRLSDRCLGKPSTRYINGGKSPPPNTEMLLRAVEAMMIGKITMKEPGNFGFEVAESQKTFIKF